jgi:hypothetical protein
MQIDPLLTMRRQAVKSETVTLLPLDEALDLAEQFYYPATSQVASHERFNRVFAQWNRLHGDKRFAEMTLNTVQIEYVFDKLNRTIEPYYVFSGAGKTVKGDHEEDVRLYVAASSKDIELRGPYRE